MWAEQPPCVPLSGKATAGLVACTQSPGGWLLAAGDWVRATQARCCVASWGHARRLLSPHNIRNDVISPRLIPRHADVTKSVSSILSKIASPNSGVYYYLLTLTFLIEYQNTVVVSLSHLLVS